MSAMPKRNNDIYIEIENFKDYELTNNVAYEMMIRNDEFIRDRLFAMMNDHITQMQFLQNEEFFNMALKECERVKLTDYPTNKEELKKNIISNDIDFEEYLKSATCSESFYTYVNKAKKWGIYVNEFVNAYDIKMCLTESENYFKINGEYKENDEITNLKEDITSYYEFLPSRPQIRIKNISKVVNIELNLSLPKDELIAIISNIKDEADKGNIKNPIELLGEKLQRADNLICNAKGECFDTRTYLSKQQKVADMFYIYDCLKVGVTQRKIQNEVYNYYADKQIETITLDAKTLKKYKDIAIDYIDNMRYKELITGVKIEDLKK